MATEESPAAQPAAPAAGVNVRLLPTGGSDKPVFANVSVVRPGAGVVLLEFGFLDPMAVAAARQLSKAGKKGADRADGCLAARVALSFDALASLHRQTEAALKALAKGRKS
ncbi:MAG: hypothetical protein ACREGK_05975 [Geminicoccales bacterium]